MTSVYPRAVDSAKKVAEARKGAAAREEAEEDGETKRMSRSLREALALKYVNLARDR